MSSLFTCPGGKDRIKGEIATALYNVADGCRLPFREPFVGGGSIALHFMRYFGADRFWLNDLDAGVACFWQAVMDSPETLLGYICGFEPSASAFFDAREALRASRYSDPIIIGFLKLVVQRLSYGGFSMTANPIGGSNNRRVESRWAVEHLIREIRTASDRLNQAHTKITNLDFASVIEDESERSLLYIDPPYWVEGKRCYHRSMTEADHIRLAGLLKKTVHVWVLSYGDCLEIRDLYSWASIKPVAMKSNATQRWRTDLIITARH